jgi:hypothetical protein
LGAEYTASGFSLVVGQVTLQGQTYSFENAEASAELVFDAGSIVLPQLTDTYLVTLSVPFTLSGSVQVPNRHEPDTYEFFDLYGSGVATVTLVRHLNTGDWIVSNVTYEFEPRHDVTQP